MSGGSPPDGATPALGGPGFLADGAVAVTRRRTVSVYALAQISIHDRATYDRCVSRSMGVLGIVAKLLTQELPQLRLDAIY